MHADPTAVGNLYGMVVDEQPSPRCVLIPLLPSLLPAGLLLLLALGLVHVSCWPSLWTGCRPARARLTCVWIRPLLQELGPRLQSANFESGLLPKFHI